MKKVKLTTVTLAMLAGAVVAPMVSHAEDNQDGVQNSTEEVKQDDLTSKKQDAKYAINAFVLDKKLSLTDYYTYEKEIDAATSSEDIQAVVNKVTALVNKGTNSSNEGTNSSNEGTNSSNEGTNSSNEGTNSSNEDLEQAKKDAKQDVANLFYAGQMSEDDYFPYAKRIDAAQTSEAAHAIAEEAKNTVAANLAALKETTKANIAQLYHSGLMSVDKYYEFADQVDAANTATDIKAVEDAANVFANSDLNKAQVTAKQELADLVRAGKLTEDNYYVFSPKVDAATTVADVDAIVAEVKAFVNLNEEKEAAKHTVNEFVHTGSLTLEDYYAFEAQIDAATSSEEIQSVISSVNQASELGQAKKDAKQEVANLVYAGQLKEEDYYPFAEEIDAATTADEAKAVVAKAQALAELNDTKLEAKYTINDLVHAGKLTLEDYYAFEEKIDASKSLEEVQSVVDAANNLVALNDAKYTINDLVHAGKLTLEDYYAFEEKIDASKSLEEVQSVVDAANNLVALNDAKLEAKYTINDLVHAGKLTLEDYYAFEEKIDASNNLEEVQSVVDAANNLVALNDAKLEAKYTINDLVHAGKLTLEDYYAFEEKIDASKSLEEVQSVVDAANNLVALNDAKLEAKYTINDLVHAGKLTLDDYYYFANKIDAETELDNINNFVATAKDLSEARVAADDELLDFLSKGKITKDQYKDFTNQHLAVKTAPEVEEVMNKVRALVKSGEEDNNKPGEEDNNKPGEEDNNKPGEEDNNKPGEEDNNKPGKEDNNKPGKEDNNKPGKEDNTKPGKEDNTKPGKEDNKENTVKPVAASNKVVTTKTETVNANNDTKVLPQTGDSVEKGLVLGGLTAMLSSAMMFFRKK
ncbi:LPXTG cell wall anchor domain-containing protein [Vagococcus luciliae]|uniref:Gram-positive cocci surface proteins LPxTG domain-containing protein n=1 Tax=Vagococcus luciliae TaxID=2920380 RepID=A0ABY5NXJ2_9ENTE|nr:LPXTG cell wall anchor domain-containing protein [Vagococcus luciliae]UUV98359.1 hypothetical protein G314FT_04750 [Vagococcus luciliae]